MRMLTYLSTLPGKQSSMCMPTLHQSSASIPQQIALFFYFLFFWVGELFITHTRTCNERNHKCQTEGHPQPKLQATLTTWVEADTKVRKEATCKAKQAAHKAVVNQPTAKPVHFLQTKHHLCLNQPNIAVKITTSRAYDVHCKPKGSSAHHNLNQWMKHTRESNTCMVVSSAC